MLNATVCFQLVEGASTQTKISVRGQDLQELADRVGGLITAASKGQIPAGATEEAYADAEKGVLHAEVYHQRQEDGDFVLSTMNSTNGLPSMVEALVALMKDATIEGLRVYKDGKFITRAQWEATA